MSGKKEGRLAGSRRGFESGFISGAEVACAIVAEVGYYEGYCIAFLQKYDKSKSAKARKIQFVEKIQQLCKQIQLSPSNEHLLEQLELLRKLAKQAEIPGADDGSSNASKPTMDF